MCLAAYDPASGKARRRESCVAGSRGQLLTHAVSANVKPDSPLREWARRIVRKRAARSHDAFRFATVSSLARCRGVAVLGLGRRRVARRRCGVVRAPDRAVSAQGDRTQSRRRRTYRSLLLPPARIFQLGTWRVSRAQGGRQPMEPPVRGELSSIYSVFHSLGCVLNIARALRTLSRGEVCAQHNLQPATANIVTLSPGLGDPPDDAPDVRFSVGVHGL